LIWYKLLYRHNMYVICIYYVEFSGIDTLY